MRKDENGHITVEVIGAFLPFVFLVVSILALVNIVTVQARVHYAMTQTANTLSMYSYVLHVTGAAEKLQIIDYRASQVSGDIEGLTEAFGELGQASGGEYLQSGQVALNRTVSFGGRIADDPKRMMQDIMNYGIDRGIGSLTADLANALVGRYLSNGGIDGDRYLSGMNVIGGLGGLDFSGSRLINQEGDLELVVNYKIDYRFWTLPLPFSEINVNQTVKTKAWLGGRGEGYTWPETGSNSS